MGLTVPTPVAENEYTKLAESLPCPSKCLVLTTSDQNQSPKHLT